MERTPRSGEIYRHFKNKLYQIVAVATHSETGERLVIYQAMYGTYQIYARPYAMFVGEVDHKKYPRAMQKYRFEKVEREELAKKETKNRKETAAEVHREAQADGAAWGHAQNADEMQEKMMAFFDARDLEEKYNILVSMRNHVTDHMINNMAVVLDVVIPEGEIDDRYESLKACIQTKQRYERERQR
ncbi:MAG: DUF1653 domain-containing protein [Clostridiales bacterium]|nr:DUF1653 domain-containing protein [Clostridiales bacterium]